MSIAEEIEAVVRESRAEFPGALVSAEYNRAGEKHVVSGTRLTLSQLASVSMGVVHQQTKAAIRIILSECKGVPPQPQDALTIAEDGAEVAYQVIDVVPDSVRVTALVHYGDKET